MSQQAKDKKRVSLGVGLPSTCQFVSRCVWSRNLKSKHIKQELLPKNTLLCRGFVLLKPLITGGMVGRTPKFSLHNYNLKTFLNQRFPWASRIVQQSIYKVHELQLQNMLICSHCRIDLKSSHKFLTMFLTLVLLMPGKLGARTAQTGIALINGKTQVRKVPKKSPHRKTVIELSQGNSGGACNDINLSNSHLFHQYRDNLQKMQSNVATVFSKQVVSTDADIKQHTPVECDISVLDTSMQTECTNVNTFTREEVIPLCIWADRNSSKDYKACIQQNGDQLGYDLMI